MNMRDIDDEQFEVLEPTEPVAPMPDDLDESEQKMLALMEQMTNNANMGQNKPTMANTNPIPPMMDSGAKFMNVKPKVDDSAIYWDVTGIPTGYKLYPEGTAIKARPLKVLEVKKLTSINEYNADQVINDILSKCITGIDINELYISDKLYLIFWLRANSFRDSNYLVDFICPKCDKDSHYHFNIDSVNIDPVKDEYNENRIIKLSSGDEITIRLLKVKDEIGLDSFKDRYGTIITNSGDEIDDELLGLSFMIDTINGKHPDPLSKYNYILGLDPQDYSTISTYVDDNIVGVKPYMNVVCEKCGGESQIGITFRPDFFLPKYRA